MRSTLKITSAMKLVSSAKLRKAQNAIAAMRPYQAALEEMMGSLGEVHAKAAEEAPGVVIAIASNSSLCGSFNSNVIAKARSVRTPGSTVYSIGRKMADAMTRDGFPSPEDLSSLAERPAYAGAAALVEKLSQDFDAGRIGPVTLVYTHFVSTARQVPVAEQLLPFVPKESEDGVDPSSADCIIEPSPSQLQAILIPKTLKLKLFAAILDSAAAEHASRTIAMQTATDNGQKLLDELTLQYNKGRQQKITNEILDLSGGQAAQ